MASLFVSATGSAAQVMVFTVGCSRDKNIIINTSSGGSYDKFLIYCRAMPSAWTSRRLCNGKNAITCELSMVERSMDFGFGSAWDAPEAARRSREQNSSKTRPRTKTCEKGTEYDDGTPTLFGNLDFH